MRSLILLLIAASTYAQSILPGPQVNPPLLELKQFLELSDTQYAQIFQNITQHQRTLLSYQQRIAELQRDIAIETAREQPSASELGTRYVEVEINCRLMNEEGGKLRDRNQALLTAAQKTKLQVLLDAIKLFPIISQAQTAALITPVSFPIGFIGAVTPTGSAGAFLFPAPSYAGCPTAITRTPFPLP
ncbi:MAG: hypothetical protein JNK48_32075 [Bryobacterales bacterium]|nr:hypothetical protein [Bryobacterales bacterium]